MKVILDTYEQHIEDALSRGEFTSTSDLDDTKELFQEAVKNYRELQETKALPYGLKKNI